MQADRPEARMWVASVDAVVSCWYSDYAEARACLEASGGYLLPHEGQFFITGPEGVRELGLDPDDSDWKRIGFDWVRPKDPMAWERLWVKRAIAA